MRPEVLCQPVVGGTPMFWFEQLAPSCDAELIGKLEVYNPAGSV